MIDAPASAAVPLSRAPGSETARHPKSSRDSLGTKAETPDLKALARLVLARDSRRDNSQDKASRKARMIVPLARQPNAAAEAWGEAEEERGAIVEHDGRIPRQWAEGFARLDPDRPPADVPPSRWLQFVDDVGRFLDSPFCAVAAALGWGPFDLFGCDRDAPFARIGKGGLLWLLNGGKLIALTEDTATIEIRTHARQTWRRNPMEPGCVLAWELSLPR